MNTVPLSTTVFAQLARVSPAPAGLTALWSALHVRRLLLLKALLVRVHRHRAAVEPGALVRFERSWELLEQVERRHPVVVRDVLDYPTTGTWLAGALTAPVGPDLDRLLGHLDGLAATAALRSGGPLDLTVETPDGLLPLPGVGRLRVAAGRVRIGADGRTIRFHPDGGRRALPVVLALVGRRDGVLAGHGPGWSAVRSLSGGVARLDDLDPYRVPEGAGVVIAADRADTDHGAWSARWHAAQGLLARTDPGRAAEVAQAVRAVVPVVPRGPRHLGATLSAAPGAVLTSLPDGGEGMAMTLVHELHHSKLATLHELVPLYGPGRDAVHRVGWRRDPRPVAGVLHGAYAHLALADLCRRAALADGVPRAWQSDVGQQFGDIHDQVGQALRILLESDELTSEGREFTRHMWLHHASLGAAPLAAG
ncbi:HEXXH motif-containing putative peptide modification protein [Streptomyces sp. NPDC055912]|uniref:aKG-HExxH-type peptide beta-hydroxylase n=1 Tax=Streptomyces sp. NPDC055912 TaxID=3345660 RepID=UPI0035D5D424